MFSPSRDNPKVASSLGLRKVNRCMSAFTPTAVQRSRGQLRFLLDTNVISELALKEPDPRVVSWLQGSQVHKLALSYAAVVEIARGVELLRDVQPQRAIQYEAWLDQLLRSDIDWLPLTPAVARLHGRMLALPSLKDLWTNAPVKRQPKCKLDLMIAAQAITANTPVATFNVKDFIQIDHHFPLPGIFDPREGTWIKPTHFGSEMKLQSRMT